MNSNKISWMKIVAYSILLLLGSPLYGQGISMSPTRLFFSGKPGDTLSQTVIISNGSGKPMTFSVNTKDWSRDPYGEKVYAKANTLSKSNASWISMTESTFTIDSGQTKDVQITMRIPANASATDVTNSMIFFSQLSKQDDQYKETNSIGIKVLFEFGLHVYYTPVDNKKLDMEFLAVEDQGILSNGSIKQRRIGVKIKDSGNTICDASIELELTNKVSGEDIKLDPISISMMPDAEQMVYFNLPDTISGAYFGVTILKIGGSDDIRVAEKKFDFK